MLQFLILWNFLPLLVFSVVTSYGRLPIMMRIYFQENNKWLLKYWHVERIFNLLDWHDKIKFNTPAVTGDRVEKKYFAHVK